MTRTPGPWTIHSGAKGYGYVRDRDNRQICAFGSGGGPPNDESEANARLIAAAPDFAAITRSAQRLANSRGGDYSSLSEDELCGLMVEYDEALARAEELSAHIKREGDAT